MPFRVSTEDPPKSLFSRTIRARNGRVVQIEDHTVPPPMAPNWGTPQPDSSTQMQCDNNQENLFEESDPKDGPEFLGTGACLDGVHQADRTYANLAAEMTGEPVPPGTVSLGWLLHSEGRFPRMSIYVF